MVVADRRVWKPLWIRFPAVTFGVVVVVLALPLPSSAQPAAKAKPDAKEKPAAETKAEDEKAAPSVKLAEPKNFVLTSGDGLKMRYTYYPGTEGKETVPILLLHDHGPKRSALRPLAEYLQEGGHAIFVPDLRGHGESVTIEPAGTKKVVKLTSRTTGPLDLRKMVEADLDVLKNAMLRENNAGKLNIRKLGVVGIGMGATVAMFWTARDWSFEDLGANLQGKDVHALILVAPQVSFKGVPMKTALESRYVKRALQDGLAVALLSGNKDPRDKVYESTVAFHKLLEKALPGPPKKTVPTASKKEKEDTVLTGLHSFEFKTTLQGTELLEGKPDQEKALKVFEKIDNFVNAALAKRELEWAERK